MKAEPRYVQFKQLNQYLDEDVLASDRKYKKSEAKRKGPNTNKRSLSQSAEIINPAKKAKVCESVSYWCEMRAPIP